MPLSREPIQPRHVDLENTPFNFPEDPVADARALVVVRETYEKWSRARQASHDSRWMANDRMYLGTVQKKFWGDNKTPRNALGIPISFDQVESVYPIVVRSLFGRQDWIGVESTLFSTPQQARALADALMYQLSTPQDVSGISALQHLKISVREGLIHGEGGIELGIDPTTGNSFVNWMPIKDFYFDPQLGWPNIDKATAVIAKKRMTVEQLESLRGQQGYNIPPSIELSALRTSTDTSPGARLEDYVKSLRGQTQGRDTNPDPAKQHIDVFQFWSDDRVIWTLNNRKVVYNQPNPYGFKPFCFWPCTILPGEAYGISMPDMLEGEQLLIQGITNAALDNLALALFPPRYRQTMRGMGNQDAWKPGMVADVSDLKGVEVLFPQSFGSEIFQHLGLSERRAQRRFGVSELAQSGTPMPSNANRTAGGVRSQEAATSSRIGTIIENIEDYLVVPMLYKLQQALNRFVPQSLPQIPALSDQGEQLVPRSVLGRSVRFKMTGASSLAARNELLQIMTPVSQTLLSEPVLKMAAQQGQTMDFNEWARFFLDATTGQRYAFFRQMTQEEMEAQQQPDPDVLAQLQKTQMEGQIRQSIMQQKVQGELAKTQMQIESSADLGAENSALKLVESMMKSDTERAKVAAQLKALESKSD